MTRAQAVDFLTRQPYKLGHMVGFNKLTELHNDWIIRMLTARVDTTMQGHRGSYKTTCITIALPLIMVLLPNKKIMFMRKTDNDIKEVIAQVKKVLQDPHTKTFVQSIYGVNLELTTASATEISTNLTTDPRGTAQLVGVGMGGSLTGKHFDYIFTDDIVNVQDRVSKAERDRTKMIYQELQNIKNRGGRIFNTGTPWHKDDCFSIMPPAEKFDCYSTNLISPDELAEIKSKMVPSLFAANYELRHVASEDVIFPEPSVIGADRSFAEQGISHVDAAYGGGDYVAFTICRRSGGKYYVYGRLWHKHIDDVEDDIVRLHNSFCAGKLYCEDNGDKGYLAKSLKAKGLRVVKYHEGENKFIKISSFLKPVWNDIIFVDGTDREYIDMICDFNENAEHDDAPDSLASVIRIYSRKSENSGVYTPLI